MLSWLATYLWYLRFDKENKTQIHSALWKSLILTEKIVLDIAKPLKIAIPGKRHWSSAVILAFMCDTEQKASSWLQHKVREYVWD